MDDKISDVIEKIRKRDNERFAQNAYMFVSEAVGETAKKLGREKKDSRERHVTGVELSEGLADFALDRFGPMTFQVLKSWGISNTRDIGDIVFSLIDACVLSKSENDSIQDFDNVYGFQERFLTPWNA